MKKRILSALMAMAICISSIGTISVMAESGDLILSDTTKVNVENTDTCFAKATDAEYHADSNYYMHFKSEGDWLEVAQNLTETAVAGGQYALTVIAKPVSGTTWFRIGWDDTGWLTSGQTDLATDLGDGWYKYVKEITMTGEQGNFLFHNDGAAEIYVDSISLKPVGEDKELLPNGGFEAINYNAESGVITANATTVNVQNTDTVFAKMIGEEIPAENEYSLHFKATANDWLEVTQNLTSVAIAGNQYVFTAYVKPVTGKVWFYIDWDATGWMATHAADVVAPQPDGWTKVQKTITMTEDKSKLLFHNDGETEMYIDDISLVAVGGTENLISDGGFCEVSVAGGEEPPVEPEEPAVDIPDEDLILSETTRISANAENCYARVTDNEKNSGNYSLHLYTEGDWIEIAQNYTGSLAAGTYIVTWYAKGTGTIWFYSNWGTEFAATHAVDSAEVQSNGWTKYTRTLNVDGDGDVSFLFHGDGAVDCYIDNISLVSADGVDYIIDGGFEEVTIVGDEPEIPHEHSWDEGVVTLEPTTEAEGVMTYTCECGETYTEAIERLPAEEPDEPAVDIPDEDLILSDTTKVSVENTDTCFAKVTDNEKNSGNYGLHLKATAADWIEVTQSLTENAVTGEKYVISAYVKPVQGRVWFRLGWDNDAWLAADATLGTEWVKVEKEVTVAGNEGDLTTLIIHNDGATEFYIDDISVVKAGTETELVPDGGFEEVTVKEPTVDIPDEDLILSGTTHINVENTDTCFAKVTDNEKNSGSYGLHFKAAGSDWLEVDQTLTETAVAGGQYVITAYIKPVAGTVWFRIGWDDTGWMISSQEGTVQANGWTKIERAVTLTADQTKLLFHNDGATEFYIDDISLKAVGSDVELMPDGGFEEVTLAGEEPPHEHVYAEEVTLAPTHTADGVKTFTCECGDAYTESIPAKADEHTYVATENEDGSITYTCECGDTYTEPGVEPEHNWNKVVTLEPTTTDEGIMTYTCSVCGETYTESIPVCIPGDMDGDTTIDTKDVITIRRSIVGGFGIKVYKAAADVLKDGVIDIKDVITIRRFVVGGYGVEL